MTWTEDEQRAWLEALVVGDRVTHSDPRARGIVGTVTATWDHAAMGDIRVKWDVRLPWLAARPPELQPPDEREGWHSPGFLRPPPEGETLPEYERARVQLVALRAMFDEPEQWSKGMIARDQDGDRVEPTDPGACSWCLIGGLCAVSGIASPPQAVMLPAFSCIIDSVRTRLLNAGLDDFGVGGPMVGDWNDQEETTHGHLISVLDDAIGVAETWRDLAAAGTEDDAPSPSPKPQLWNPAPNTIEVPGGLAHVWQENHVWYWCFDGCMDAKQGPFTSRSAAIDDARSVE